ncbi:MAG: universal stress protein [Thermoplasmata archaeon]|nr:universal stress protein [Thermoplasmata archaeon]
MDRVLIVCDFQSKCAKAVEKAIDLAGQNSFLILLYVVDREYCREIGKRECKEKIKNLKKKSKETVRAIKEKGFKCRNIIRTGELLSEITKESKRLRCTFIIIEYSGAFSRGSIEEISNEIMNSTSLPVMAIS